MERVEQYFKNLRFDKDYHLGLGDIRITLAQQEQILSLCKHVVAEKDKEIEQLRTRLNTIWAALVYGKTHQGGR